MTPCRTPSSQRNAPCPCPQACPATSSAPADCPTWRPAAHHPSQRPGLRTELRALALHCAAVGLAVAALVFIVKTAPSP